MAKKNTTAVAVVTPSTDVITNIDKLNNELSSLQKINETPYKTGGSKTFPGFGKPIKDMDNIEDLIKLGSSVSQREKAYNEFAETQLGLTKYATAKFEGHSANDWIEDIKLRLQIVQYKKRYDELTTLKKEWEELMDKEDKKVRLIKKMESVGISTSEIE